MLHKLVMVVLSLTKICNWICMQDEILTNDLAIFAKQMVQHFTKEQRTIAVAESCTGGFISHLITNVPGASRIFLAGLTTYANAVKESLLHVPSELLQKHGAVSAECATAMVQGLKKQTGANICVATTGIAGPDGGTADKPVGTVFVAILNGQILSAQKLFFPFDRDQFKQHVAATVLQALRNIEFL